MYSPLKDWGALEGGLNVGIVGIGGLGQARNIASVPRRGKWCHELFDKILPSDGDPFGGGHGQRGDRHFDEPEQEGDGAQDGRQALHRLEGTSSLMR